MASRELNILIKAKNLAGAAIAGVKKDLRGLDKTLGKGISTAGKNIERGIAAGVAAFGAGVAYSLKAAGDFEAQMNTINTVARLTPPELEKIGDGMRALSRKTGVALDELTSGYYDLVSAGIDASHAQDVLEASVTLSIGGLSTAGEAINLLSGAINTYGGDATQAGRYADIFAKSIEQGKVTAADLASTFAQIGPLAANNGIEIEELAASYALLTSKNVPASEAATQMSSALVALMRRTGDLEKLEKATGKSYLAIAGKKGLVVALEELRKDGEKAGIPMIDLMGRIEGLNFLVNTTGDNLDDYTGSLDAMTHSQGTAAAQMAERQKGLNFQLDRLKANAHDAAITIGNALIPMVADLAGKVADWAQGHQDDIKQFAADLAKGFQDAVEWAKKLDWDAILGGLQTARDVAKVVLDTFLKMPAWVQTAVVTGWGLNKLTGGMVGTIVGQLASGLIKGVLGINAGVVNVTGGVVNTGPGVGPGGAPGRGIPPIVTAAAVGVAATVPFMQGSNVNTDTQVQMLDQAAHKFGATVDSVLATGATLGAIKAFTADPALRAGVPPEILDALDKLANQTSTLNPILKDIQSENEASKRLNQQIKDEVAKNLEQQRLIRANTADAARWAAITAAKNFSPNVSVTANLTNIVQVSAQQVVKTTTRIAGATTVGGFIESF